MIEVKGKYKFIFSLGSFQDFLLPEDLEKFVLTERTGNILPMFEMKFLCRSRDMIQHLNEGAVIELQYGRDDSSLVTSRLAILKSIVSKTGHGTCAVTLAGVYAALPYLNNPVCKIYTDTSASLIGKMAQEAGLTAEVSASTNDSMNWVRWNISPKAMVQHLWEFSNPSTSFLVLGITAEGKMRVKTFKDAMSAGSKYIFTPEDTSGNRIHYDGDYIIGSESGIMNKLMGYNKFFKEVDEISGEHKKVNIEISSEAVGVLNRKQQPAIYSGERPLNPNVYEEFWKAHDRNRSKLGSTSLSVDLAFDNIFYKLNILDTVGFVDPDQQNYRSIAPDQNVSGKYVVARVTRSLTAKTLATTVRLCRETYDNLSGGGIG